MKHRTMKKLLTGMLAAAILVTTLPANFTLAHAASKTPNAATSLKALGIIDQPGEEDTDDDLPDIAGEAKASLYSADNGGLIVAIDPGHGGTDQGASYGGIKEKDINLKIAQYVKVYLEQYVGVQVYLTRSTDVAISLADRVANAEAAGADVFISLHNNALDKSKRGSMVFYPNESYRPELSYEGAELSASILKQLTALGLTDLGIRTRNSENNSKYADGSISDYYGIIRNAKLRNMTGIIVEHACLSNDDERAEYLSTDEQLMRLALADVQGIAEYYGLIYNGLYAPELSLCAPSGKALELFWDVQEDAKGYVLYRSLKKNSGYQRIAKIVGSENNEYIDETVESGKTYYYKVRAYDKIEGITFYSDYSNIVKGYTLGAASITEIKQMTGGYLKLSWKAMPESSGYAIYRSDDGLPFEEIDIVSDPNKSYYNDRTVEPGMTYSYKVRPLHMLYGYDGYGKYSSKVTVTMLNAPDMKRIDVRDSGYMKVVWYKVPDASAYVVQRSTSEDEGYKTIATINGSSQNYYYDKKAERGMTYYYRVKAMNESGKVKGSTAYGESLGEQNFQIPELTKVRIATKKTGMSLTWTKVAGAEGYRIYRSTQEEGGYKRVGTVKGADVLTYIDTSETEVGTTYYYKVRAYVKNSAGTALSVSSEAKSALAGYSIMGKSSTTPAKMAAFFEERGGVYPEEIYSEYDAPTLEDFCQIVYDEAVAEGVRAEVVFGQICKETGFLRFGGDVEPEQCNFAGIGATGGGAKGASFPDVQTGIRAQVQHLKAYASDEPLNNECVDPRFTYVKRCSALYVEWLGINENPTGAGWATGKNYGYSLRDDYIRPLLGM